MGDHLAITPAPRRKRGLSTRINTPARPQWDDKAVDIKRQRQFGAADGAGARALAAAPRA